MIQASEIRGDSLCRSRVRVTFKYDPFGRRISKSSSAGTSIYGYDGYNLIGETNGTGGVVARYAHEPSWDSPLAMLRAGVTSYYEQDGLKSVGSLTNSNGALAQTYTYDAFGKSTASAGALTNPFQYTGRELDTETGLYYYRARYYDPSGGRFISEDPLEFAGKSVNFYRYAYDSPADYIDPFGLQQTQPVTPTQPTPPPAAPPVEAPPPVEPVLPVAGGGAATAGGGAVAVTVGLAALDVGLAIYDGYQIYKFGQAYGWWGPGKNSSPSPQPGQQCGKQSKCTPLRYDKQLLGCRYICDDGTMWFKNGSCEDPLYKPWGQGYPKYPPIPKP